ncbi:MAG: DNA/RNA nuclease SfsA [Candidatus Kariarchaeaceae archaeon]
MSSINSKIPFTTREEVVEGIFINRPNRFIAFVQVDDRIIRCHLPNPGRMTELLCPEKSKVHVKFHSNPKRKTKATLVSVSINEELIQLDSNLVAKWLPYEFKNNTVPGLKGWRILNREKKIGRHRFDFILLDPDGNEVITEVKSTTKVVGETACFPDAISQRATDQTKSLIQLTQNGYQCMLLFIVQRFATEFSPCSDIDPEFSKAFKQALVSGVNIHIILSKAELIVDDKNKKKHLQVSLQNEIPLFLNKMISETELKFMENNKST